MRVTYQSTLDDFVTVQILSIAQPSDLQRLEKRRVRCLVLFMALFAFIILLVSEAEPLSWLICYAFVGIIWLRCICAQHTAQRKLFRTLKEKYGDDFSSRPDHTIICDVTSESICFEKHNQKTIIQWPAVHKLTLNPQFLAIDFGLSAGSVYLLKRSIVPTEYQAFCEETIRLYREHAAKEGRVAEVVHSDWQIDFDKFTNKRTPIRDTKFMMAILWTAGFILLGMSLLSVVPMLMFFINTFTGLDAGVISGWLMAGVIAFSLMLGLAGLILSLMEKLPGTKRR